MYKTILVNKQNKIKESYLKKIKLINTKDINNKDVLIEKETYENYLKLKDFLKEKNIEIGISSAYRSIVVIGQAGERDYLKRPKVGNVVVANASYAIFTYEDPRSEDPAKICEDIISELKATNTNYEIVIDRRKAIQKAVDMAKDNDMVLILGKGNETYEKLKDKTIYFNDIEEAYNAVASRKIKEGINS